MDNFNKLISTLKKNGFLIIATDIKGKTGLNHFKGNKIALALGNEGNGLSEKMLLLADRTIKIPFNEKAVESLNVAIAGAIVMYKMNG